MHQLSFLTRPESHVQLHSGSILDPVRTRVLNLFYKLFFVCPVWWLDAKDMVCGWIIASAKLERPSAFLYKLK
jgi:hypothetical protein